MLSRIDNYEGPSGRVTLPIGLTLFAWAAIMIWTAFTEPADSGAGLFFIIVGLLEILFYQAAGRMSYKQGAWLFAKSWERAGLYGSQILCLGIGIALVLGGLIRAVRSLL